MQPCTSSPERKVRLAESPWAVKGLHVFGPRLLRPPLALRRDPLSLLVGKKNGAKLVRQHGARNPKYVHIYFFVVYLLSQWALILPYGSLLLLSGSILALLSLLSFFVYLTVEGATTHQENASVGRREDST